jgi:hypothetical protein
LVHRKLEWIVLASATAAAPDTLDVIVHRIMLGLWTNGLVLGDVLCAATWRERRRWRRSLRALACLCLVHD